MLSKVAACRPAMRCVSALGTRSFHSSKPVANNITIEERKGPTGTIVDTPGVIDQYGTIPFFGLLATALVTKEVFIFNEETLVALNTVAVVTAAYIGIGNKTNEYFDEVRTQDNDKYHDSFNAVLEQVQLYKSVEAKKLEKVGVIKELCTESREVNAAYLKFLDVKVRHEARDAMLAKLNNIHKAEASEEAAEYGEFVDETMEAVRDSYLEKGNNALREASLTFAIQRLGEGNTDIETDPVRLEIQKQFELLGGEETA